MGENKPIREDHNGVLLRSIFNKVGTVTFIASIFLLFLTTTSLTADADPQESYMAVPGLIDNRSQFSDGAHSIEELVGLGRSRGFKVISIND